MRNTWQMNSFRVFSPALWHPLPGVRGSFCSLTGGVVALLLNHRLIAVKPPAWGGVPGTPEGVPAIIAGLSEATTRDMPEEPPGPRQEF